METAIFGFDVYPSDIVMHEIVGLVFTGKAGMECDWEEGKDPQISIRMVL